VTRFALILAVTAAPLAAQSKFEITPSIGAYVPNGNMIHEGNVTFALQSGIAYGVRLSINAQSRTSFEMTFDIGASRVLERDQGQPDTTWDGKVAILGLRVRHNLRPGIVTTPFLSAGFAYLNPTSVAFQSLAASGPALSFGGGLRVVTTRRLVCRLEVSNYLYPRRLHPTLSSQWHDDLLFSAGIGLVP